MKAMIQRLKQWLSDRRLARKRARLERLERQIDADAERKLQVAEYNGGLYVTFHGVPLVYGEGATILETLEECREIYRDWRADKNCEQL